MQTDIEQVIGSDVKKEYEEMPLLKSTFFNNGLKNECRKKNNVIVSPHAGGGNHQPLYRV